MNGGDEEIRSGPAHLERVQDILGDGLLTSIGALGTAVVMSFDIAMDGFEGVPDQDCFVLARLRAGGAVWTAAKPDKRAKPGSLTLNSFQEPETWFSDGKTKFDLFYVPQKAVAQIYETEFDQPFRLDRVRDLRFATDRELNPATEASMRMIGSQQSLFASELQTIELLLANAFVRALVQEQDRSAPNSRLSDPQMALILDLNETMMEQALGLDELAAALSMDVYAFARAFKTTTGQRPHKYFLQRRIERACELLAQTNESIAEISYACGFASQSHLTTTFSKTVGTTPGAFRREARA